MKFKGKQKKYGEWRIPVSIHPAPKRGWGATNELSKAWINEVPVATFLGEERYMVSTNRSVSERRKADGSVKKSELGKLDIKLWAPVTWSATTGSRSEDKVRSIHALVLDLDGIRDSGPILERLESFTYNAHSTFSNGSPLKKGHCFRVVLPLSRPVTLQEWPHFWRVAIRELCPECDPAAKDPARFWYVHSCRDDRRGARWNKRNDGACVDVDAVMQSREEVRETQGSMPIPLAPPSDGNAETDGKYKVRYVSPEKISVQLVERGQRYTMQEIINDWDGFARDFRSNRKGYINCICPFNGTTSGSAFLKREQGLMSGYELFTLTSNATRTHFRSITSRNGIVLDKKSNQPIVDRGNAMRHMAATHSDLWLDIRTGVAYKGKKRLEDYEIDNLGIEVTSELNPGAASIGNQVFLRAFYGAAAQRPRDPLREKLEALPKWRPGDEERIDGFFIKWLKVEDTPINRVYSRKFFIGALARAMDWGCRLDSVLIIKGEQGIQKSKLWEALSMGCFVDEKIDITDKDGKAKLRQGWIVEMAELANLKGKMIEDIRHFITLKADMYREPWGYKQEYHPRRCALVGSTNEDSFNLDAKGSRRMWIMESKAQEYEDTYDEEELRDVVPHLWAEAMHYYLEGRSEREDGSYRYDKCLYWLTQEEFAWSKEKNAEFKPQDSHEQLVHEWLVGKQGQEITVLEVVKDCYHRDRTKLKPKTWSGHIPQILRNYGCTSRRGVKYGHRRTIYDVPLTDELAMKKQLEREEELISKLDAKDYYNG